MTTTGELCSRVTAAAKILEQQSNGLPQLSGISVYAQYVSLSTPNNFVRPWQAVADVAAWAAAFNVPCWIKTTYDGAGTVAAEFERDGVKFRMAVSINTSHAYELGAELRQKLPKNDHLIILADHLAATVATIEAGDAQ
ncbi:hypothetical protein [Amycolatopsis solani]|uniref:hypothetical protein n=1 Tax=Amycolatopsis solani TaxID=3028615 RepID=UPI0025B055FF|nr:hypothetical protein [Amycolatopsis sp. MEP2-6]